MVAVKNICDRIIWLEQGEIRQDGNPDIVTDSYLKTQNS
jgi:ABC-type polysaccharide/polyol phosphate transport system ATPase subunit